jgi:DNA-cytosine methyltransferase
MKVLSLFDGMSCGRIALDQLGIPVEKYYASEIDKYAIQVSQANYPDIIQVGDICDLDPKDYKDVDLMLAGSPCQGFSFAGKQLAFDDPRSALFFEFIRLLKAIKPKYFLLENVRMKKEFLQVISEQVSACYPEIVFGIEPIFINSSLVSAQSRQRYYWTNMPNIKQPEDSGIVLKDILEENFDSERDKAHCIDANYYKGASVEQYKTKHRRQLVNKPIKVGVAVDIKGHDQIKRVYSPDGKSPTVNTCQGGNREPKVVTGGAFRGRAYDKDGKRKDRDGKSVANQTKQMLELRQDSKSNAITTVGKDSVVVSTKPNQINPSKKASGKQPYMQERVFHKEGKSHALTREFASRTHVGETNELTWRKLTPLECERLQTVPDNYTNHVSNTQRYKMLGNGWTVEVIKHIFKNMEVE